MVEITAALVKELSERTGAGMMDCKKALSESQGDFEKAVEYQPQSKTRLISGFYFVTGAGIEPARIRA